MSIVVRPRPALHVAPAPHRAGGAALVQRQVHAKPATTGAVASPASARVDQGPFLDYSRSLTLAGGVLIIYKDLDLRWRQLVWKAVAWGAASGAEAWYVHTASPLDGVWFNMLCWFAVAALNLFIVWQPVEVYRRIEIRSDGLILDGEEVFWRAHLTSEDLRFEPDDEDNLTLGGVYGTRFVEFATLRRFDEFDRMPETFAAHFEEAVGQLGASVNQSSLPPVDTGKHRAKVRLQILLVGRRKRVVIDQGDEITTALADELCQESPRRNRTAWDTLSINIH